jgi:hypothetical protein
MKKNLISFRVLLLSLVMALMGTGVALAQITIGSVEPPNANALLDLKQLPDSTSTKGLLLPRVALQATNLAAPMSAHVAGMTVYNKATAGTDEYRVSPGFYYNTGTQWERMYLGYTNWFYMPSVAINTATTATNQHLNLYNLYKNQFSAPPVRSAGAPAAVPYIPAATDLYYYIIGYDASVFNIISLDVYGELIYDVTAVASDFSYINIVFVLK